MQMPTATFHLLWNYFPNAELTDSETSSPFGKGGKATSSVEKQEMNGWRKQDDGYYNNKPNDSNYFKKHYQEKTKQRCVVDVCGSTHVSCKSNFAKHRRTKKCQKLLVRAPCDFMIQENLSSNYNLELFNQQQRYWKRNTTTWTRASVQRGTCTKRRGESTGVQP